MRIWLLSLPGLLLFGWPLLGGVVPADAPAYAIALGCMLVLLVGELGARQLDSRRLALLAALAAIDAGLRLAVVIGIGGFSPVFFLILCAGWIFGPSYGFLVGSFSLFVSAFVTGGVGPWLPYQMLAAGWVGTLAGLGGWLVGRLAAGRGRSGWRPSLVDLVALALVGVVTGFLFGALTDIQTWTTGYQGTPGLGWSPDLAPGAVVAHFARFYLATSLAYDTFRAVGNALAVLLLGLPVLAGLGRLRGRLVVEIVALDAWPPEET